MLEETEYKNYENKRTNCTDRIITSSSLKKVVIAGPGTGKTYLFKQLCKHNCSLGKTNNLTLSFINTLVDELTDDLYGVSEVRTLHSFALRIIPKNNRNYYSNIENTIKEDYEVINKKEVDFRKIFCNLLKEPEKLKFYSDRRKYYNYFGPNCSVYAAIRIFEDDSDKIPQYSQILVDEYQDFNKLEARFIELLSSKSPLLVVGDDDQSLYTFKDANPKIIRDIYIGDSFERFELPFCSRCTAVTINAFDNILKQAKEHGFLKDRVNKKYLYFPNTLKDSISQDNPKIYIKRNVYHTCIAYHIDQVIRSLDQEGSLPKNNILIICPLKIQINKLAESLIDKGYRNIDTSSKNDINEAEEALRLLLENKECNLGWRIISKHILKKQNREEIFKDLLYKSCTKNANFMDLLEKEDKTNIKHILTILKKAISNDTFEENDNFKELLNCLDINPTNLAISKIQNLFSNSVIHKGPFFDTPIKITTILGAKGLSSNYVFLVNFDDKFLLDKEGNKFKISDGNICKFLVSLTRAKNRTYIFTGEDKFPTFVNWINNEYLEEI